MIKVPEEIKNLYLTDGISKNIRISFPNGEHDDIINDNIGFNSAKFTESTCSNSDIRLGMSEANIFECELYDIPNIRGYYIAFKIREINIFEFLIIF